MLVCKKILIFCAFACCGTLFAQNIQNPVLPGVADAGVMIIILTLSQSLCQVCAVLLGLADFSTELQNILDEPFNPDLPNAV